MTKETKKLSLHASLVLIAVLVSIQPIFAAGGKSDAENQAILAGWATAQAAQNNQNQSQQQQTTRPASGGGGGGSPP